MKIYKTLLYILLAFMQCECKIKQTDKNITLKIIMPKIQAAKLKGKYLYLFENKEHTPNDSVMIESETVFFHLKTDSLFIPHIVSLKYTDTSNHFPYKRLAGFKNPFLNKTINSFFYIDKGVTTIGTYYDDSNFINSFSGSKQNEPYLKNISLFYRENDTVPAKQIELRNIEIIKKFPYSLYLLTQLFYYKEHFSNNELHALLAYFDGDVKNTAMYKSFYSYFKGAANFDKAYPVGVRLQDTLDVFSQIGDDTSPFNLFVFWAS